MNSQTNSPLLLFYPTSPVHVRDFHQLRQKLPDWRCRAILYNPLARVAPGIQAMLQEQGIESIDLDDDSELHKSLPEHSAVLALGAVFEPFALELFAWAKHRKIPVIAIEEVAQLALNQSDINNYDAPFDRLFVASTSEQQKFLDLGYPSQMMSISGLLANDRLDTDQCGDSDTILKTIGVSDGTKPIVYTTSPLRTRLALHNKDDLRFREAVLIQISAASRRTGRRVVVKLHPNEDVETEKRRIWKICPAAIVLCREINMDELFTATGILVNRGNSQTCLEAVLRGLPTVVVACGLKTLFHNDGGVYIVEELSMLAATIEQAHSAGPADNRRVKAKHYFVPSGGVADFIATELSTLYGTSEPVNEASWNWLIKSLLFLGRQDRALRCLESIDSPSTWQEIVRRALMAHAEGRIEKSIREWENCCALDPNWYFPHYEMAHGYHALGEKLTAIEHANQSINLHPPFHSLWHEIPMRVVIMATLRKSGNAAAAVAELNSLAARGLVDVVPELLVEKAAQMVSDKDPLSDAIGCLQRALEQLKYFPVNQAVDMQLMERVIAGLCEVADECLGTREYQTAERCYTISIDARPNDVWPMYQLGKLELMRGNIFTALRNLQRITTLPDGPRKIIDRVLSARTAARLNASWPVTAKSIVKPLKLTLVIFSWAVARLFRSGFKEILDTVTPVLLVATFVVRHFVRRLNADILGLQRIFRKLRYDLLGKIEYRYRQVKSCPICLGQGKFEYQNRLSTLLRCVRCDHVYARHPPNDQVLTALYGDMAYWEKDRAHQGITSMEDSEEWTTYLKARMGILQRLGLLTFPANRSKSVFEIGCAEGMLLHHLKKLGMKVTGCEMNRAVAEQGVQRFGVDIRTEPFEDLQLPEQHCDLVVSFHTLEHMRDPAKVLAKVARVLRPDGAVLVEVPCGKEEYENTDHLHFFSDESLRLLLSQYFASTEIIDNAYTNSAGVKIGSLYGFGRGVRRSAHQPAPIPPPATSPIGSCVL